MGALQDVELSEAPPGVAAGATADTRVAVTIGPASKGSNYTPLPFSSSSSIASQHGCGPGPKAAAYAQAKSGKPGIFIAVPKTARAATTSAIDKTAITGTLDPTVTGTPNDGYDVRVVCTAGGTIGSAGISLKWSLDGGKTFTAPAPLGTATTLVLTGTGLTLNFTAPQTLAANDAFGFWTYPASASVLPITVTRKGSSTSAITVSGTPEDAYRVRFEVRAGGTIGTAGILVRYSLDAGRTWSPEIALGTANTLDLQDGKEDSGINIDFGAGTLEAGDAATFATTAPEAQAADILTALDVLKSSALTWGFLHVVGEISPSDAGSIAGRIGPWASGARRTFTVLAPRDRASHESDASWSTRVAAQWSAFVSSRVAPFAGYSLVTCPITGRKDRRPLSWNAVARILKRPPQIELGRVRDGVLESDVEIHDSSGRLVEHDGNDNATLANARFGVARTYDRRPGIFLWIARVMGAASDIQRLTYRRILDVAGDTLRDALLDSLEDNLPRWGARVKSPFKPGDIREDEAVRLEGRVRAAMRAALVSAGMASDVEVTLNRTPTSIGPQQWELSWEVKITAPIYIDGLKATYGITDPALDALLNTPQAA